ncbi:hypothetical protein [Actinopolyspora halophila]|uniref:hypothetical protein n=1 Tax=Actinopolyspora halophila TaxID=1850 RepID=UPI00035D6684|nr:hypothetical protein [Actinopolyspora halophila]
MTWEDELQQLDAELAAGRISADEYRQRRDSVLGRAHAEQAEQSGSPSGGFPAQQPAWPQQHGAADPQSGGFGQQQQQNPFPPAFSWQQYGDQGHSGPQGVQQPPRQSSGDSTRVVNVNHPPTGAPQQPGFPQQGQQPGVPPGGWPNSGQFPQQPGGEQAAWAQQWPTADAPGTPWGNSDLPPEHGDTSWMRQGPEVFETAGKSGKGKIAGFAVGGVLLVGVIVAGVFSFLSGEDGSQQRAAGPETSTSTQTPTSTEPPLPEPPEAKPAPQNADNVLVPPPEGKKHPFNKEPLKPAALEGAKSGVLFPPVLKFALDNGVSDGWFNGTQSPIGTSLIAVRMPDESTAEELTRKYRDQQETLTVLDDLSYQGVPVHSSGDILRAAYTTHDWMVVVEVRAGDKPASEARSLFEDLLSKQLAKTPPTVRE